MNSAKQFVVERRNKKLHLVLIEILDLRQLIQSFLEQFLPVFLINFMNISQEGESLVDKFFLGRMALKREDNICDYFFNISVDQFDVVLSVLVIHVFKL